MQSEDSQRIVKRFFEAIDILKANNVIRGVQTFTSRYEINKRNFYTCRKTPESDIFQVAWLWYLAKDYKVSSEWLLSEEGGFFQPDWDEEKIRNLQKTCKNKNKKE